RGLEAGRGEVAAEHVDDAVAVGDQPAVLLRIGLLRRVRKATVEVGDVLAVVGKELEEPHAVRLSGRSRSRNSRCQSTKLIRVQAWIASAQSAGAQAPASVLARSSARSLGPSHQRLWSHSGWLTAERSSGASRPLNHSTRGELKPILKRRR